MAEDQIPANDFYLVIGQLYFRTVQQIAQLDVCDRKIQDLSREVERFHMGQVTPDEESKEIMEKRRGRKND